MRWFFVLSDFLGVEAASASTALRRLASKHDVVPVCMTDPRERDLPNVGLIEVQDPETGHRRLLDTASKRVRRDYLNAGLKLEAQRDQLLRSCGLRPIHLVTGEDVFGPIHAYFRQREKGGGR